MRKIHWLILAVILIVGVGLRVYHCTRQPLSDDELGSMETTAGRGQIHLELARDVPLGNLPILTRLEGGGPIWVVPLKMQQDVHPPLYFVLLRIWLDLFGDGDAAARSLSIVAGMMGLILIFDIGRLLRDPAVGLWAAAIMGVAQPQIIESQDARPYTLAIALGLAAWDMLIRVERKGASSRRFVVLGLLIVATALSHYYTAGLLLAMFVYAAIRLRGPALRGTVAAFAGATLLGILFWGHGFLEQTRQPTFNGNWMYWFNDSGPGHISRTLMRFAGLPLRYLAEPITGSENLMGGGAVLYLLPFLLMRRRPELLICGLWLVGAAGVVTLLDLFRQTSQIGLIKYTLIASPAVYLMLPMLLKSPHWIGAAALLCAVLALPDAHRDPENDWRALASHVNTIPADEPLVIDPVTWGNWYGPMLFMGTQRYAERMPKTVVILDKWPLPGDLRAKWSGKPIWLLAAPGRQSRESVLPGSHIVATWRYPNAELFQIWPKED